MRIEIRLIQKRMQLTKLQIFQRALRGFKRTVMNNIMKELLYFSLFCFVLIYGCNNGTYYQESIDNAIYYPNTCFYAFEDISSPRFAHLKEKYQLDTIFHGETDEMERVLLLRHWIKSKIAIEDFSPEYPGNGYVEEILDAALCGTGFHCGHFSKVQNAVMNAYGYLTRGLGVGPGVLGGADGHHGINEIWLNSHQKWFLSDAKYDHHFEKDGIPLSALEIRDEYLKNKAADITMVHGLERTPLEFNPETEKTKEEHAQTYTWTSHLAYGNMFTVWPKYKELLLMFDDEFSRNNIWYWGGKPHWTYAKPEFVRRIADRHQIEWTPNTIASHVTIAGNRATIELTSDTPNLLEYQVKLTEDGEWEKTDPTSIVQLKRRQHSITFRTKNLAGVTGPEHKVIIKRR